MVVTVSFVLYKNIQNMYAVKDMVKNDLKAAVINPSYILHSEQLIFAVNKVICLEDTNEMKTRNKCTELLYCLSPSKSIRDALKTFGVEESGDSAIFAVFDDDTTMNKIREIVKGDELLLSSVREFTDVEAVRNIYNIPSHLTEDSDMLNCIITRMSSKDLL